jgi:aryl-alcohol dehydrogenase-like predicted oxidoreductase
VTDLWPARPERKPVLMLGTATFGSQCDESESRAIIDHALDNGVEWLDTATSYPLGSGPDAVGITESMLGRLLAGRHDRVKIATKVYNRTGPGDWQLGLSKRHVLEAVSGSLDRLGTDHVDLLQLHRWDDATPIDETLEALGELLDSGRVRAVGCCNFNAAQLGEALDAVGPGRPSLQTAQTRYSLVRRGAERALLPLATEHGLGILAFNVLAGGLLTGKYDRSTPPVDSVRFGASAAGERYRQRYWTDDVFDAVAVVKQVASDLGMSMSTLATAWVLHRPGVTGLLIGVTKIAHLDDALTAARTTLPADALARLEEATSAQQIEVEEIAFESS